MAGRIMNHDYAKSIRLHRVAAGITLSELARRAKVDRKNLYNIEIGKTQPSIGTLEKIANGLNIELKHLFADRICFWLNPNAEDPDETKGM